MGFLHEGNLRRVTANLFVRSMGLFNENTATVRGHRNDFPGDNITAAPTGCDHVVQAYGFAIAVFHGSCPV